MNVRLILAALSFCLAMAGCLAANLTYSSMVEEINKNRPGNKQLSSFGFTVRLNFFDHLNEYRTLYPNGRLRMRFQIANTTMFIGLVAVAACLMLRFQ